MTKRSNVIKIKNLSYKYSSSKNWVLKDINLEIPQGTLCALIGPSGGGKSTLLTLIRGFHQEIGGVLRGEIKILGKNISHTSVADLGGTIGIVFQNPALQLHQLRVVDEVASAPMYQGLPYPECQSRATTLIDSLLGKDFYYLSPNELSAGQQQKVALAASLSLNAEILLLDEPFSFLDKTSDIKLLELLIKLHREGKTILVATHDIGQIAKYTDLMGLMDKGSLVLSGSPKKVLYSNKFESIMPPPLFVQVAKKSGLKQNPLSWEQIPPNQKILACKADKRIKKKQSKIELSLNNVSYTYPDSLKGIKEINLNLYKEEVLGIIGANGSGKTTLAKIILGLLKSQKGKVLLNKKDITKLPIEKRARHIGYVTQDPLDMFFEINLWDEVAAGPRFLDFSNPKEIAQRVLKQFNLWQYKGKHPDSISGGEKSKLGIADIIANDTQILLLDEPEFGLDPKSWEDIENTLINLKKSGKTIIVITQNLEAALFLCDRIALLKEGKLVKTAPATEIFKNTKLLLDSSLQPLPFTHLLNQIPDTMTITKEYFLSFFELRNK